MTDRSSGFTALVNRLAAVAAVACLLFAVLAGAGAAFAQTTVLPLPEGVATQGQLLMAIDPNSAQGASAVYTESWTPAQVAADTCAEQTFTVTGVNSDDVLIYNASAGLSPAPTHIRPSGADTVAVTFCNPGNGAATPAAHTATILAIETP